jgi:hypothetical protein
MREIRDDGEPISAGRQDRQAAEARTLRDALFAVALFTGVVLVNGIVSILLIELFQAVGWWEGSRPAAVDQAAAGLSGAQACLRSIGRLSR